LIARPQVLPSLALALLSLCLGAASPSGEAVDAVVETEVRAEEDAPTTPPDLPAIQALPGYRAGRVATEVFPGEAYVLEAGPTRARTVVLIHGISRDGAHDWDLLIPVLARTRRVLAFDLPGFGRSDFDAAADYGPRQYADFIDELIEQRVRGRFDIVAHSMGVSIGLELARRHVDRVDRIVVASAAAILHGHALSLAQIERGQRKMGPLGRLLDPLRHGAYDVMGLVPDKLVHALAIRLEGEAAQRAAAQLMAHDLGPALDAIRAPTLVLWGPRDDVVSPRGAWVLASRLREARIAFLDGAGHRLMGEPTTDEFNRLVTRWLAGRRDVGRALAPDGAESDRVGSCFDTNRRVDFEGEYDHLDIRHCGDVRLHGVRAHRIEIFDSVVTGEDVVVTGSETAVSIWKSRVQLSGGSLTASVPLRLAGSELDLAGITFNGRVASVEAVGNAKLLCSLCLLRRPGSEVRLHGFRSMNAPDHL
jgi:pimeloyl-ACP methyl ester carboxylesterase